MARKLTAKREAFCQAYVANGNDGMKAYCSAYDVRRMSEAAIRVEAHKLLKNPMITLRIEELQGVFNEKVEQDLDITPDFLLKELAVIVKTGKTAAGRMVKTSEQVTAFGIMGRWLGMEKVNVRSLRVEDFIDQPGVHVFDDNGDLISSPLTDPKKKLN